MRIAIHIEKFTENFPDEKSFLVQLIGHMVHLSPQTEFILITGKAQGEKIIVEKNITKARVAPVTNNTLVRKAWLNIKLPVLLKKYNADIFISDEYCSLKTKIPQLLLITDHRVLIQQRSIERKHTSYKRIPPKFLKKAKTVICFSDFVKKEIENKYQNKIDNLQVQNQDLQKQVLAKQEQIQSLMLREKGQGKGQDFEK